MVETDRGLNASASGLLITEIGKLSSVDLAEMFGSDYVKRIEDKAVGVGICDRLVFFDPPKPHEGSQAVYVVEQFVGNDLILVAVLRPNMRTSKHRHEEPMLKERYLHIAGESFVSVNGDISALNQERDSIEVPLNVSHQVHTNGKPSLTLIVMENARLVPQGRLHIPEAK